MRSPLFSKDGGHTFVEFPCYMYKQPFALSLSLQFILLERCSSHSYGEKACLWILVIRMPGQFVHMRFSSYKTYTRSLSSRQIYSTTEDRAKSHATRRIWL